MCSIASSPGGPLGTPRGTRRAGLLQVPRVRDGPGKAMSHTGILTTVARPRSPASPRSAVPLCTALHLLLPFSHPPLPPASAAPPGSHHRTPGTSPSPRPSEDRACSGGPRGPAPSTYLPPRLSMAPLRFYSVHLEILASKTTSPKKFSSDACTPPPTKCGFFLP